MEYPILNGKENIRPKITLINRKNLRKIHRNNRSLFYFVFAKISTNAIARLFFLFIERIEHLKKEKQIYMPTIHCICSEADANGFEPIFMFQINKRVGFGKEVLAEESSLLPSYRAANILIEI